MQFAQAARDVVLQLQGPAGRLTGAGDAIRGAFDNAAATAAGVPFVGDDLARALGTGSAAGDSLSLVRARDRGDRRHRRDGRRGRVVLLGVVPVVAVWLTLRVRWVRAAASARTARAADPDLLALQALTRRPTRRLLAVTPEPGAAWRARRPGGGRRPGRARARRARAARVETRSGQEVTVTRRVSVMTGRPAPSDGSSSATRIS